MVVHIADGEFVDEHGRALNLRGVNLGGSSKIPIPSSSSSSSDPLDPHSTPSFVGRPFPLADAPLHFRRLRACGFNVIRFIVTWEAIEHEGPGIYDKDYLQYVREVLEVARQYEIKVYVDPHQDVWCRWTGGDGAPLWTLEAAGFDVTHFPECEAALCRETYGRGHSSEERKKDASFPKMIWPTNYFKLACATMFTLFWAGERFAPNYMVDGSDGTKVNVQTYLQTHYTNAMAELLRQLKGLDNIIGIGTLNEPSPGYVNVADLSKGYGQSGKTGTLSELRYGLAPTPFQGMCLGEGHKQKVGEWSNGFLQHVLGRPHRWANVDPNGKRAWKDGRGCVWEREGVWRTNPDTKMPELRKPHYFADVDFGNECYLPFATRYAASMRKVWDNSQQPLLIFVELPPLEFASTPFPQIPKATLPDAVNATHWYDGVTLFTRTWRSHLSVDTHTQRPVVGYRNIFRTHVRQLADIKRLGTERMENSPSLIGECGIPYDMVHERWNRSSTFGPQLAAMDHTVSCLEENLLHYTLWNYTSDNTNAEGDVWNGEDLSIYSQDQKLDLEETDALFIYDGLRAARAFVRPYAHAIAGTPGVNKFDMKKGVYRLIYEGEACQGEIAQSTEIFVPKLWCMEESEMKVKVSDGGYEVEDKDDWLTVRYWHGGPRAEHLVEIEGPAGARSLRCASCKPSKL